MPHDSNQSAPSGLGHPLSRAAYQIGLGFLEFAKALRDPRPSVQVTFTLGPPRPKTGARPMTGEAQPAASTADVSMTTEQQCGVTISIKNSQTQEPLQLTSGVTWTPENGAVCAVTPDSTDPNRATVISVGAGTTKVNATCKVDLGGVEVDASGSFSVEITDAQPPAQPVVSFTFDAPVPKPT